MLTTAMVSIMFLLVCGLFVYSKQGMLKKLFTNQMFQPASELQNQFEMTADKVILNLESHITHLEDLIEQADERIELLDSKLEQIKKEQMDQQETARQETERPVSMPTTHSVHLPYGITQYNRNKDNWLATTDNNSENSSENTNISEPECLGPSMNQQSSIIIAMFKQGYTEIEIAKATGLGQGEIALFVQLHNKN